MEWRKIEGYHYSISEFGIVRNDLTGKSLKIRVDSKGYHKCNLYDGHGNTKGFLAHRLVAMYFLPQPSTLQIQVNHIDGNPMNNHHSNLEWCTPKENSEHAVKIGLFPRGETHHYAKITDAQINEIRFMYNTGQYFQHEIAKMFGINQSEISRYVRRKRRGGHCG